MASRIDNFFSRLRAEDRTGLMPFVTAGYPNLEATAAVVPALEEVLGEAGGIVELGIPFSDPIADGPVIAQSMHVALEAGVTPRGVFDTVRGLRPRTELGLVAMVSDSIVHRVGSRRFVAEAADAGFDGLIVPDLDIAAPANGQGPPLDRLAADCGLSFSMLVAPDTPDDRLAALVSRCSGFVYVLTRAGITGEQQGRPEVADRVEAVRRHTDLPVAVGFGISRPEHVEAATATADAAIVGSAIVRRMTGSPDPAAAAAEFVKSLIPALVRRKVTHSPGGPGD